MRLRFPLGLSIYLLALLASCTSIRDMVDQTQSAATAPTYVQGGAAVPQSPQTTVTVGLPRAQTAGDLLVVFAGWNDSTAAVTSVTDSRGDAFTLAIGPTRRSGALS